MPKDTPAQRQQMRLRIAHLAARMIAEDGISDYGLAKRKAARQAGAPDSRNLPTNLEIGEVPFQPWAKALYEARRADQQKNDPHARCVPPGGPRQFHTPYGLLIYELPEAKRVLVLSGGGPRTWRVIFMDGRPHPTSDDFIPTFLGHSVGKWEGDTLAVDSVGFNEQFWFARAGYPHTESLHLIERISRPDYNTLKYEATIDDPKAYTKSWTGGHYIYWVPDEDFEEYFCQDNNRDPSHLVGQ